MDPEKRSFELIEIRAENQEGEAPRIVGQAAVYNRESKDLGGFVEIIEPGFFSAVLGGDTRGLFNHDRNYVLGRTTSGTLRLIDSETGLGFQADGPWGQTIDDLVILPIQRGDVNQCSFAFYVKRKERGDDMDGDDWREDKERGIWIRTLKAGGCRELPDVSVVTYPAYIETFADVRAQFEKIKSGQEAFREGAQVGASPEAPEGQESAQVDALDPRRRELELAELTIPFLKEKNEVTKP